MEMESSSSSEVLSSLSTDDCGLKGELLEMYPVRSGVSIALLEVLEKLGLLKPLVYGVSLATGL